MTTNHLVLGGLDLALIEGTKITALCGVRFVPEVRVGSGGRADVPGAPMCEDCESFHHLREQYQEAREERNAQMRRMRAIVREAKQIRSRNVEREKVNA